MSKVDVVNNVVDGDVTLIDFDEGTKSYYSGGLRFDYYFSPNAVPRQEVIEVYSLSPIWRNQVSDGEGYYKTLFAITLDSIEHEPIYLASTKIEHAKQLLEGNKASFLVFMHVRNYYDRFATDHSYGFATPLFGKFIEAYMDRMGY